MLARLIATVIHEVVKEYRCLDGGDTGGSEQVSNTALDTERAEQPEAPFGFTA